VIRVAISQRLVLLFLLLSAIPARAQVRPGLAHEVQPHARHDPAAEVSEAATHDPDFDGALIGGAVGAAGLSIFWAVRCEQAGGGLCGLGVLSGTVIGGLAGLVIGGLVDAADPLTSPGDRPAPARTDTLAAADSAAEEVEVRRRSPVSRRNDLIGAAIGAIAGDLLAASVCSSISDTGGYPLFHPAYLPVVAVGALLGAGIGSAIGETEGGASPERTESP